MNDHQFSDITKEILRDVRMCEARITHIEKEQVKLKIYLTFIIVIANTISAPLISFLRGFLR